MEGIIEKALSGFYYVRTKEAYLECKARGRFRLDGTSPLVGDRVECSTDSAGRGRIDRVLPRKNWFIRPAVANIDALVFVASQVNPVTDPFLVDRVGVIAAEAGCELIICVNKTDLNSGDELVDTFSRAGYPIIRTSARTGEGCGELLEAMKGKVCAFTGNSGVGKSSILNVLLPEEHIETGEVSQRLGRGKHTTRHVELYQVGDCFVADTPGFASFDIQMIKSIAKEQLAYDFPDFTPYLSQCRFADCAHRKEPGCAVREAVEAGKIGLSRYRSYEKLYDMAAQQNFWEIKDA